MKDHETSVIVHLMKSVSTVLLIKKSKKVKVGSDQVMAQSEIPTQSAQQNGFISFGIFWYYFLPRYTKVIPHFLEL